MSGYNKQFSLEYPKKLKENAQQKNYATVSLCCLTVTNPFRDKIIRIVLNPYEKIKFNLSLVGGLTESS